MRRTVKILGSEQHMRSEQFRPEDGGIKEIFTQFLHTFVQGSCYCQGFPKLQRGGVAHTRTPVTPDSGCSCGVYLTHPYLSISILSSLSFTLLPQWWASWSSSMMACMNIQKQFYYFSSVKIYHEILNFILSFLECTSFANLCGDSERNSFNLEKSQNYVTGKQEKEAVNFQAWKRFFMFKIQTF